VLFHSFFDCWDVSTRASTREAALAGGYPFIIILDALALLVWSVKDAAKESKL
jgi:hypothetical protein